LNAHYLLFRKKRLGTKKRINKFRNGREAESEASPLFLFFPFFTRRNLRMLAIFVFFPSFFGLSLGAFLSFLRVGAIAIYAFAIADVGVFCYRGLWGGISEVNGFLEGNAYFRRWVRRG
jgi:hypothetical protein